MTQPTEDAEQKVVVEWLQLHNILHHHGNRKGQRKVQHIMNEQRLGSTKGFPDLLVFDPTNYINVIKVKPGYSVTRQYVGTAIEMKRKKGGRVSPEQQAWLDALTERGWATKVCHGADEAIEFLKSLGYGRREG